jgi:hypothetical protein
MQRTTWVLHTALLKHLSHVLKNIFKLHKIVDLQETMPVQKRRSHTEISKSLNCAKKTLETSTKQICKRIRQMAFQQLAQEKDVYLQNFINVIYRKNKWPG